METLYVRPLTDAEREHLRVGLRSPLSFNMRRCQCLLASAQGKSPAAIGATYGLSGQAVRNLLRDFAARGLDCLTERSSAPIRHVTAWPRERDDDLKALLHQSPRNFGRQTSLWTLDLLAAVCQEKGWTERVLTGEAIRQIFIRLEVGWMRAKHWLTSPDPEYAAKKKSGTG